MRSSRPRKRKEAAAPVKALIKLRTSYVHSPELVPSRTSLLFRVDTPICTKPRRSQSWRLLSLGLLHTKMTNNQELMLIPRFSTLKLVNLFILPFISGAKRTAALPALSLLGPIRGVIRCGCGFKRQRFSEV